MERPDPHRMPLRVRLAYVVHRHVLNPLAWRYARPPGPQWGIVDRIDRRHPLWRLNDRVANVWTSWWVEHL
jgi:hypothetical protein